MLPWIIVILAGLFAFALIVICAFLILKWNESKRAYASLADYYRDLIDIDAAIATRQKQLSELQTTQNDFQMTAARARVTLSDLQREIASLEETLDLQSYGIYKPHYDFSTSEEYKERLESVREKQKKLITEDRAAICSKPWTVDGSRKEGERMTKQYTKLMLRAFNSECDAAILKVRWNNILVMSERIDKCHDAINKLGVTHAIQITDAYMNLKMDELRLAYEYQKKLYQEQEEQKRIREQMREEEKAQRELEKAQRDAEEEEDRYEKALAQAKFDVEKAKGAELEKLNQKIALLEQQVAEAEANRQRALSQAQLTKRGVVYIISNIGSFGENVYKIGMTRRLEPMDRVRELGDASVPFEFDVHAMIRSDDAPALESHMQEHFKDRQVNLVNDRKEFFNITLADIEVYARKHNVPITLTKIAEAREYRETLALRAKNPVPPTNPVTQNITTAVAVP